MAAAAGIFFLFDLNLHIAELGEFWTKDKHYGEDVFYQYVEPDSDSVISEDSEGPALDEEKPDEERSFRVKDDEDLDMLWFARHAKLAKYSLQFRKCSDEECCKPRRCDILTDMLKDFDGKRTQIYFIKLAGFLPPIHFGVNNHSIPLSSWVSIPVDTQSLDLNYDKNLPSVMESHNTFVCKHCNMYWPVKTVLAKHIKVCVKNPKKGGQKAGKGIKEGENVVVEGRHPVRKSTRRATREAVQLVESSGSEEDGSD